MIFLWDWIWVMIDQIESMTVFPRDIGTEPGGEGSHILTVWQRGSKDDEFEGSYDECRKQAILIQQRVNQFLRDGKWVDFERPGFEEGK